MSRYSQLNQIIRQVQPKTLVEIGTWNGDRAVQMCRKALKFADGSPVRYMGFDLFDDATAETDARELNVKAHFGLDGVAAKLDGVKADFPNFDYILTQGDTRDTLAGQTIRADFVFIDGGHSVETIASDYNAVQESKVVVLDDFYSPDAEGRCQDIQKFGCNQIVNGKKAHILPVADPVKDGGLVQMVCIGFEPKIADEKNFRVHTKNSISDVMLARNIGYSTSKGFREVETCRIHGGHAIMVSGGPSYREHLDEIRALSKRRGNFLVCVKSSHDFLISQGIVPWGCVLLDPRPHVLDFVSNPHPKVTYLMASQVAPRTVDRLVEANAKVVIYHALVGEFMKEILSDAGFIMGGSTAATRGVMVLGALGFRKFTLFGYDSCYPDNAPRKGNRGQDIDYLNVTANGRQFWTDAEFVAQAQDFEYFRTVDVDLTVVGDGMIPHVWGKVAPPRRDFEEFVRER